MKYRSRLFSTKNPYDLEQTNELFFKAVKENCLYHYNNCNEYKKILDSIGMNPLQINSYDDISKIPFLPTLFFKNHNVFSMPAWKTAVRATSSGTKGRFSKIRFEASGLYCGLKMVLKITKMRKILSLRPTHYIMLGYKPHIGNKTAVTKTAFGSTLFAPALSRTYALEYEKNGYKADLTRIIKVIQKYSRSRFPVRLIGFPSYTYFVLKLMEERNITVKLKKGSKIMLGGGWKQFYTEQVDKNTLYELAKKVLGIDKEDIAEFYGAVEHPILYCDCVNHHFHIPAYSRVIIRDVHTLKPVKNGTVGLVNLVTPMVKATPILSVMTDDLGVIHEGKDCGCGIASPYLEIIGRVGLKDIKTCAAGAAELLDTVKI